MNTQQYKSQDKSDKSETKKQDIQNFSAQSGTNKADQGFGELKKDPIQDQSAKDKNNFVDKMSADSFPASDPPATY